MQQNLYLVSGGQSERFLTHKELMDFLRSKYAGWWMGARNGRAVLIGYNVVTDHEAFILDDAHEFVTVAETREEARYGWGTVTIYKEPR